MSARGRARRGAGGETRVRARRDDEASVRTARSVRDTPPSGEADRRTTNRRDRGRSGEGARGDAPVLERDGHGVLACTTPLARVRPRLATSRARVCGDPHDRNALKRVDAAAIGLAPLNPKAGPREFSLFGVCQTVGPKKAFSESDSVFCQKKRRLPSPTAAFVSRPPVPRDGSPPGPRAARRGGRAVRTPHRPPRPSARVVLLGRGAV